MSLLRLGLSLPVMLLVIILVGVSWAIGVVHVGTIELAWHACRLVYYIRGKAVPVEIAGLARRRNRNGQR